MTIEAGSSGDGVLPTASRSTAAGPSLNKPVGLSRETLTSATASTAGGWVSPSSYMLDLVISWSTASYKTWAEAGLGQSKNRF